MEEKTTCSVGSGLTGQAHEPSDFDSDGYPLHSRPAELRVCLDSRVEQCPYAVSLDVRTERVRFQEALCFYADRVK